MSYEYQHRKRKQLKNIARQLLRRFSSCRIVHAVDIEALLEQLGLEIIFRPSLGLPVEAYTAKDPRYIVMREDALSYPPRSRFTMAEEVCHRILEYQLWQHESLPKGAAVHELTPQQHRSIERDAAALAAEILQPENLYRQRFEFHRAKLQQQDPEIENDRLLKRTVKAVAGDLIVSEQSAAFRAKNLGLITHATYKRVFPLRL